MLLGTEILDSLLYYVIIFPSSSQGGLQITDGRILLELDPGLQEFLHVVVALIVPRLVIPGLGAPGLTVPGVVAPRLTVPALIAPRGVIPGLVTLHGHVSRRVHQTPLMVGIEAGVFCRCWVLRHIIAIPWPVVFLPFLTFHSLVLEPGLHLLVAEVQDVGKFLHLLETEVFLPLKSVIEHTQLGL